MNTLSVKIHSFRSPVMLLFILAQILSILCIVLFSLSAHAAGVTQVSTGSDSTCAVKDFKAYCWGSNSSGKLGNGGVGSTQSSAVAVRAAGVPADPGVCSRYASNGSCSTYSTQPKAAIPGSDLGSKRVAKVSVGTSHACALAEAQVFCWGSNSSGQLGTGTTANSSVPVSVSLNSTYKAAQPSVCTFWLIVCLSYSTAIPEQPISGVIQKEIIDISAGEDFTCALASDGSVSCWGKGANGRLGTNSTTDVSVPKAVYKQSGSALSNKKGIKLAKVGGATMCVFAVNASNDQNLSTAKPYCWGYGVGDGTVPADKYTKCGSGIGTSNTSLNTSTTYYFDALKPRDSTGVIAFSNNGDIANSDNITSIGNDQKAYYWGLHGYIANEKAVKDAAGKPVKTGTNCTKRVASSNGGNVNPGTGKPCGGGGTGHGSPGCGGGGTTYTTVNYYDVTQTNIRIGSPTALGPLYAGAQSDSALNQKNISIASGNALNGLFCAKTDSNLYCDAHGADLIDGRTGSNYVRTCSKVGNKSVCDAVPTGAQQVDSSGWLSGKTVTHISTSQTGYTCVIASGSLGCWGNNTSGKLGTGDKKNKLVPTAVINL